MKNYRLGYCALASMLLLASCQEDIKDDQPTINITSPAAGERVWLETDLKVDATNEQGVSKVMFYLNDELVGEDGEAPYELALDTKQYEDGDYTLRTVAYDGVDNQTEAVQEIEIFNKLLSVEVGEGYLDISEEEADHAERAWIIVSDAKGNVLQTEELQNGTTFTFDRPEGFEEAILSVTRVSASVSKYDDAKHWVFATTYTDIAPDRWIMEEYPDDETERMVVGTATGSFVARDGGIRASSPNGSFYRSGGDYYEDSVQTNFSFDMYEDPAQLYVAILPYREAPSYLSLGTVRPGEHYAFTSRDLSPMRVAKTIDLPSADGALANVWGYYQGSDELYIASQSRLEEGVEGLPVYLPENVFTSFDYSIDASFGNFSYYRLDKENLPSNYEIPTTAPGVIVNTNRNSFNASTNYPHDYVMASWFSYDEEQPYEMVAWSVFGRGGEDVQLVAPLLPEVITKEYPSLVARVEGLPFEKFSMVNHDNIDNYDAYAAKLYKSQSEDYKTREVVSIQPNKREGSRTNTVKLPTHAQRRVDQLERAHGLR